MRKNVNGSDGQPLIENRKEAQEPTRPLAKLSPENVRIVALVLVATGTVVRRDCYAPEGNDADVRDLMQVKKGELWLRTVDWARSKSLSPEVRPRWESMGVPPEEVGRISVFTWPDGKPLRVFVDSL